MLEIIALLRSNTSEIEHASFITSLTSKLDAWMCHIVLLAAKEVGIHETKFCWTCTRVNGADLKKRCFPYRKLSFVCDNALIFVESCCSSVSNFFLDLHQVDVYEDSGKRWKSLDARFWLHLIVLRYHDAAQLFSCSVFFSDVLSKFLELKLSLYVEAGLNLVQESQNEQPNSITSWMPKEYYILIFSLKYWNI